ncbi:MAG: peptidase S10 [Anaerolineales bacterium]|nr:peptidase S10 [Anaerolineales bacterium]
MSEQEKPQEKEKKDEVQPEDRLVETKHTLVLNGEEIHYTVTTGTILLKEEDTDREKEAEGHKPKAEIFFIAYTRDDVPDPAKRPVTYSFNGGPGSSSVWLHMGLLGPRRVYNLEDGAMPRPPFHLVDNEFSLLDKTDLVFIDPVNTGYSRVLKGEKAKPYHGFQKDIETVGEFIRMYTTRYKRWLSPKFLIGESYGTTRAAGLSGYLQERYGLYLNGIMLVSVILDFATARFAPGHDLPHLLYLPAFTATAWFHKRLPRRLLNRPLRTVLDEVEKFVLTEYVPGLFKGAKLSKRERNRLVETLAKYTGLSEAYIERTDLRIHDDRFFKELLREEGRTVGRLDSRFKGIDRDSAGESIEYDPMLTEIMGTYTATFNHYVRAELNYESDLPYEILTAKVWPWDYSQFTNAYLNVAETLRKAMSINPYLKVLIANGYYDLGTPYFATEYTFNHMGLDESLTENLTFTYYEAGHMMYMHIPSLAQMKKDLAAFIDSAVGGE